MSRGRRETKFKKIIIDTYRDDYAIVAKTEDLIVEHCVRGKSNYKSVRQGRRVRKPNLQDATVTSKRLTCQHIREEGLEDIIGLQDPLAQVKPCAVFL